MSNVRRAPAAAAILCAALAVVPACGPRGHDYGAHGVVREVSAAERQVVIAHDDIPGLMPAMTMNFDVPDSTLLAQLAPGQVIDFKLRVEAGTYRVVSARVMQRDAPVSHDGPSVAALPEVKDPAPPFRLVDQNGDSLSLDALRGRVLVLDFIYTNCPGPCPMLTSLHVKTQRALDPSLRDRVRFVSITMDPVRDTPAALRAYADERGVDTANWSLLTGAPADVEAVVAAYGIGTIREQDGTIAHMVVTFLIDGTGNIVKRDVGLEGSPKALRDEVERLARASTAANR